MKITAIVSIMLIVQVSASFLDAFQGAVHSVQNSFGKLFSDLVTDVKDTVDCTILAVEYVLSLSTDATSRYNQKCGTVNGTSNNVEPKHNNVTAVEISFLNNDYLNKALPEDIDARIYETMIKINNGYNPHDKLAEVERELAKETERLANVSSLVKQELDKLSSEIHIDFGNQERGNYTPNMDIILRQLRLLEAIEQNMKNSSEANEIHKVVESVLHKLDVIEASEVSENSKVDKILIDLENNSNFTYKDLRKRLEHWKKDEDRQLDIIKKQIAEHSRFPEQSIYLQKTKLDSALEIQLNDTYISSNLTTSKPYNTPVPTSANAPIIDRRTAENILTESSAIIPGYVAKETMTTVTTPALSAIKFRYQDLTKRLGHRKKNKDSNLDLTRKQIEEDGKIPEQADYLYKNKLDNTLEIQPNDTYINGAQISNILLVFTKQPYSHNSETIYNGTDVTSTVNNTPLIMPSNTVINITKSPITQNIASTGVVLERTAAKNVFNLTMLTPYNSLAPAGTNASIIYLRTTENIITESSVVVLRQHRAGSFDDDKPITSAMKPTMLSNLSSTYVATNITKETMAKLTSPALSETTFGYNGLKKRLGHRKKNKDRHLDLLKKQIEEHGKMPAQSDYIQKTKLDNAAKTQPNDTYTSSTQILIADSHGNTIYNDTNYITTMNNTPLIVASKSVINVTNMPITRNPSSTDVVPESTTVKNSFNLTISTPFNSLLLAASTNIPAKELRTIENTIRQSSATVLERLQGGSSDDDKPLSGAMKHTKLTNLSSVDVVNVTKEAMTKLTTPALSAAKFTNFESNTNPNYSSGNVNSIISTSRTTTERGVLAPIDNNEKLTIINTTIYQRPSTSIMQTNDVTKTITPVATTTDSYVNETKPTTVITETLLTVDSATTTTFITKLIIEDISSDYITLNKTLTTTTPVTTEREVIVNSKYTTSIPTINFKILPGNPPTQQSHNKHWKEERNLRYPAISTQATNNNRYDHAMSVVSTTTEKSPTVATKSASTTPSLNAFLNYIDRLITTTSMPSRNIKEKYKEVSADPIIPVTRHMYDPWLAHSQYLPSRPPHYTAHNNPIASANNKLVLSSYIPNNPTIPMFTGISRLTGFASPKTLYNTEPSVYASNMAIPPLYARNDLHRTSELLPFPQSVTSLNRPLLPSKAYGTPLPYIKNDPTLEDKSTQWNLKRPLIQPLTNGNKTPDVFNRRPISSSRYTPPNKKTDNFDDPDYDSFFHIPSKDAKIHEEALKEARTLIKESQRANRLMHDILSKKNKGISAFSRQKSLKFG